MPSLSSSSSKEREGKTLEATSPEADIPDQNEERKREILKRVNGVEEDEDLSAGQISAFVMLGCFGAFMVVIILVVIFSGNGGLKIR